MRPPGAAQQDLPGAETASTLLPRQLELSLEHERAIESREEVHDGDGQIERAQRAPFGAQVERHRRRRSGRDPELALRESGARRRELDAQLERRTVRREQAVAQAGGNTGRRREAQVEARPRELAQPGLLPPERPAEAGERAPRADRLPDRLEVAAARQDERHVAAPPARAGGPEGDGPGG